MSAKAAGSELLAAGLAVGLLHTASPHIPLPFSLFAAFAAALVYGLDHALDAPPGSPRRSLGFALSALWFLGFGITLLRIPSRHRGAVLAYALLALAYLLPLFPGRRRLQDFPRLRVAAILAAWTCLPLLAGISLPGMAYPAIALWLGAALLWSDVADSPQDRHQRPTLTGTWSLPRVRRCSRIALVLSTLLFLGRGLWPWPLFPLSFLLAQETLGRRHPASFARNADLLLLVPLLFRIAESLPARI